MADPYLANVALWLPMHGVNNGTTFLDFSPLNKLITRVGDTKTVTAQSKYYGSSGYFDGTGDYLTTPSTGLTIAGDFTIEGWVHPLDTRYHTLFDCRSGANWSDFRVSLTPISNILRTDMMFAGAVSITGTTTFVQLNAWAHVAWMRSSGVIYTYVNGVKDNSTLTLSRTITPANATLRIGTAIDPIYSFCYGNDYRITIGVARYAIAGFTPPNRMLSMTSGHIYDTTGAPCARQIYAYNRANGVLVGSAVSDAVTGAYEVFSGESEIMRVVQANEPTLYCDIIDRVIPG